MIIVMIYVMISEILLCPDEVLNKTKAWQYFRLDAPSIDLKPVLK